MDNGRAQKIEQVTGLGLAAGAEDQVFGEEVLTEVEQAPRGQIARERAEQLGWRVLGGENGEATQEIAQDQAELEHPIEFVGDETPLQVDERLKAQQENSLNEIDPNRDSGAKRVRRSQEKVARAAMAEVDKMVHQRQFSPLDLVRLHWTMSNEALLDEEEAYYVGKGN